MGNMKMLRERIDSSGMTVVSVAAKSGIQRETLYNKLNGKSEFKASEIRGLTETLRLTRDEQDRIFFT